MAAIPGHIIDEVVMVGNHRDGKHVECAMLMTTLTIRFKHG